MKTGKVPENVLKRSVLRQIRMRNEDEAGGAERGLDCAIFPFAGQGALASCVQEAAVWCGEDEAGNGAGEIFLTMAQLIQKCANNLAAGGIKPMAAQVALLLPEDIEEAGIKRLMGDAAEKCRELSIGIVGGQTRITGMVKAPVAVVTGYGRPFAQSRFSGKPEPGQDVVISKWIGLQGTAVLAKRNREKLLCRYPAYLVEEAEHFDRYLSVLPEAEAAVRAGACAMHDASEGGILGALWELAEDAEAGLEIDMRKLPIRQETVEVCECCNVNPYELMSGGCMVMTCRDGLALAAALEAEHIPAAVVGKVTEGSARILVNGEEIRYMDRPQRDGLYTNKFPNEYGMHQITGKRG